MSALVKKDLFIGLLMKLMRIICIRKRNLLLLKIKYIGETDFLVLTHNIIYDVISIEKEWYRIIDDSGEDYLYPPELFEIVES